MISVDMFEFQVASVNRDLYLFQLITLESVLRWGGVVDELEWAAQVHQWMIQGFTDVDDRPGKPISPLLKEVRYAMKVL